MKNGRRSTVEKTLEELSAKDLMTQEIITLGLDDELIIPADLAHWKRFKTLPVIDEARRIVGMVSYDSLLNGEIPAVGDGASENKKIRVRDIMSSDFKTVHPSSPISDVAKVLCNISQGCVAVTEKEVLLGIITTADLARLLY